MLTLKSPLYRAIGVLVSLTLLGHTTLSSQTPWAAPPTSPFQPVPDPQPSSPSIPLNPATALATKAPTVTILTPTEGQVIGAGSNVLVTGTVADDGTVVEVFVNNLAASLVGNAFSASIPLLSGNQAIHVSAQDNDGLTGLASRVVSIDGEGPSIEFHEPQDRQSVYTLTPSIAISYSDFYTVVNTSSLNVTLADDTGATTNVTGNLTVTSDGAMGTLSSPLAEDASYTLTVSLADSFGNLGTASAAFYVPLNAGSLTPPPMPGEAGWVSGVVYDSSTCDANLIQCQGLAGAQVTLVAVVPTSIHTLFLPLVAKQAGSSTIANAGPPLETRTASKAASVRAPSFSTEPVPGVLVTGSDGSFSFPVAETGRYWLRVEKDGYTYSQREIEVVLERSTATNAIYLTPLDPAVTPCTSGGCSHTSSDGSIQVIIPPDAIPAGEVVDVTATNFEQVEFLPSGDLPEGTWETYAFNLGGDSEYAFQPGYTATVKIANTLGFAPGTSIPLGYWNQITQAWEHAGTGVVDPTGQWVEMGVAHFSNYDCNDPIAEPNLDADADAEPETEDDDDCSEGEGGCFINVKSGELQEWIDLPGVNVLGEIVAPQLRYSTDRASSSEVIDVKLILNSVNTSEIGDTIGWELYIEGEKTDSFTFEANLSEAGEVGRFRYLWNGRNAQGERLSSGIYEYSVNLSIPYTGQYCYALNGVFGNSPDCVNGATGIFVDAVKDIWVNGTVTIESETNGSFGTGWTLDGWQRLYEDEAGRILVADGQRNDEFYFPAKDMPSGQGDITNANNVLVWANWGSNTFQIIPESLARDTGWGNADIIVGANPYNIAISLDGAFAYITYYAGVSVVDMTLRQRVATIGVGSYPQGIALSPDGAFAYVTNTGSDTVSVVDLVLQQEVATISVGDYPREIALSPDGAFAYVTNYYSNTVSVVDLVLQQEVATIGVGSGPDDIALSPDGAFAYVTNYYSNTVSVADLTLQQRVATIGVGSYPQGIALSPDGAFAYVTNTGSDTVSVVDLTLQQQVTTIGVGRWPNDIALSPDGAFAYVTSLFGDTVSVVDLMLQQQVATTGYVGNNPRDIALSPDGAFAYVTNHYGDTMSVIDLALQQQIATIGVGDSPYGVAVSHEGTLAYVANTGSATVSVVDLVLHQEIATIGVASGPVSLALSPDGGVAYVINNASRGLSVIDLTLRQSVSFINVEGIPLDIALSPDGAFAYVTDSYSNTLSVVDLALQQQVSTISVGSGSDGIALSPDGAFAYVTNYYSNTVSVVDLVLRQEVATIGVGNQPQGIALSPDGAFAYVTNYYSNTVSVVDLTLQQQVATIGVGNQPRGIALSPDGAFAYVTNYYGNTISVVDLAAQQEVANIRTMVSPSGIAISGVPLTIFSQTATDYSTLTYITATLTYSRTYPSGTQIHFNPNGTHDFTQEPDGRKAIYTYNADGTLATMGIIAPGESAVRWTWTFNYVAGKLTSVVDPAGRATALTIDDQGNLTQATTPDGATRRFAYDSNHLLTHYTDQSDAVTTYAYDAYGRIASVAEPPRAVYAPSTGQTHILQEIRTFTPSDTAYRLINESPVGDPQNPAPPVPTSAELIDRIEYGRGERSGHTNEWGSWLDETDTLSRTTTYARDNHNNVTRLTYPNGDCVEYTYDNDGNMLTEDHMGAAQCALTPAQRDPAQVQHRAYTYEDRFNQVKTETDPLGHTTTYSYDYEEGVGESGKLIRVEYPPVDNSFGQVVTPTVSYTYNAWGLLDTETDARGAMTKYIYTQGISGEASGGANPLFLSGVTPVPGLLTQRIADFGGENLTTIYKDFDGAGNAGKIIGPDGHETTTYAYDGLNRIVSHTDAVGIATTYEYDGRGNRVRQVVDYTPDGVTGRNIVTEYTYNAHDQLVSEQTAADGLVVLTENAYDINRNRATQRDGSGHSTIFLYDDANQLTNIVDPSAYVVTMTYTLDRRIETTTDADGYVTHYIYNGLNQLTSEVKDEGGLNLTTTYTYDLNDNLLTLTDPVGTMTCYEYDSHNRLMGETRDCGGLNLTTAYAYDLNGNRVRTTDPRGVVTVYDYDALNRTTLTRLDDGGLNLETIYTYDPAGNLAQAIDERSIVTGYTYDDLNRLTQTCQDALGLNLCTTYTYDRLNNQATVTDPKGITTYTDYNDFGLPTQVIQDYGLSGLNATTSYEYDNALNLTRITDANSHTTQYTYTPRNELASEIYADTSIIGYQHDGRGNVLTRTLQDGATINHSYDGVGRMTERAFSTGGSQTFGYDAAGRMTSAGQTLSGHTSLLTYAYNSQGDVVSTTQMLDSVGWSVGYTYNYVSGVYTVTYPSGEQRVYTLDPLGRLDAVRRGDASLVADYAYQDLSGYFTIAYPNGQTTRVDYDALRRITRVSSAVADYRYGYDAASNRTYMQRWHQPGQPADVYQYDDLYQLTQVWYDANATVPISITAYSKLQWYDLDNVGNRLEVQNDGVPEIYLPNDGQQLTNPMNRYEQVDVLPFIYDLRGNTLADGTNTYGYDILNRQISMIGPGGVAEYVYDALGRRIARIVDGVKTVYIYDTQYRILEERAGDGSLLATYTYGAGIDEPLTMERGGSTHYYHHDALGNITEMTNAAGALVERYEYDVYGRPSLFNSVGVPLTTSVISNAYLYTGRQYDWESGSYYYRARIYAPKVGRFLQMDPLRYVESVNLYEYALSNPIIRTDPSGLRGWYHDEFGEPERCRGGDSCEELIRKTLKNLAIFLARVATREIYREHGQADKEHDKAIDDLGNALARCARLLIEKVANGECDRDEPICKRLPKSQKNRSDLPKVGVPSWVGVPPKIIR